MNLVQDRQRLLQANRIAEFCRDMKLTEFVTVCEFSRNDYYNHGIFSALIPSKDVEDVLKQSTWVMMYHDGMPSAFECADGDNIRVEYLRYGNTKGIEPLVFYRSFHNIHDDYVELSEDFIHFHKLYHDRKNDHFYKISDAGSEDLVATIENNIVKIRLKEILQFNAIKEKHFVIQFDCREYSDYSLKDLEIDKGSEDRQEGLAHIELKFDDFGSIGKHSSFSRLLGLRLVEPLPKSKSGFWGFAEIPKAKYVSFILSVDKNGDEIEYTCDPDALSNNFGSNPDSPNYLSAVSFRKEVLDKYYQQPSKFKVTDGVLCCGSLWCMYIDNHHENKVCAWLGDLGRDLPYEEQLHWRGYNIASDSGISEVYFRRQLGAEFIDSDRPEHVFQDKYRELMQECQCRLGWNLLLPLEDGDEHHFSCLRIPATNEQKDFDDLVLGLAKILIDSLNEKKLNTLIPSEQQETRQGSIAKLEIILNHFGIDCAKDQIDFLRKLQNLRSASSAHRKGTNYRKIATDFDVSSKSLKLVFTGIMQKALAFLDFMIIFVKSNNF